MNKMPLEQFDITHFFEPLLKDIMSLGEMLKLKTYFLKLILK